MLRKRKDYKWAQNCQVITWKYKNIEKWWVDWKRNANSMLDSWKQKDQNYIRSN